MIAEPRINGNGHHKNGHGRLNDIAPARPMPQDQEAEKGVLGGVLIDPDAILEIAHFLRPEHFYNQGNAIVYQAILDLAGRNEPADTLTIPAELRRHGRAIGDKWEEAEVFLLDLMGSVPTSVNTRYYAHIVVEMATRRKMIHAAGKIATLAWDEGEAIADVVDQSQSLIFDSTTHTAARDLHHVKGGLMAYLDKVEAARNQPGVHAGLPTGLSDVDAIMGGLRKQDLVTVAGATSMGKTAAALSLVNYLTAKKHRGGIFSLEMSEEQLINRLISMRIGVPWMDIQNGNLTDEQADALYHQVGLLNDSPLFIDDTAGQTPEQIKHKCRKLATTHGLDYVVVDFLQLVHVPQAKGNIYNEVSEAARCLKNLAKELDIPVITLSQINRAAANRGDKRPTMADMRDSGKIEEAADVIILLYRADYYDRQAAGGVAEWDIAKNRTGGKTGVAQVQWQAEYGLFRSLTYESAASYRLKASGR